MFAWTQSADSALGNEQVVLGQSGMKAGARLACQARLISDVRVQVLGGFDWAWRTRQNARTFDFCSYRRAAPTTASEARSSWPLLGVWGSISNKFRR